MHGYIQIENTSFSRNCDIKTTTCKKRHRCYYFGRVYFYSKNSKIEPSLLSSRVANLYLWMGFPHTSQVI